MGYKFADQYSLLHFASGVVAYFFGINFVFWLLINLLYEIFENSEIGITIHRKYLFDNFRRADSLANIIGDIFFGMLGWIISYCLDKYLGDVYDEWPRHTKSFNFWHIFSNAR